VPISQTLRFAKRILKHGGKFVCSHKKNAPIIVEFAVAVIRV